MNILKIMFKQEYPECRIVEVTEHCVIAVNLKNEKNFYYFNPFSNVVIANNVENI